MSINPAQQAVMKRRFNHLLPDTCIYKTPTITKSASYGTVRTFSDSAPIACGFEFSPFKFRAREMGNTGQEQGEILSRVRVSFADYSALAMTKEGVLELTERWGNTPAETQLYEVQGFAEIGPAGVILNVKRAEL